MNAIEALLAPLDTPSAYLRNAAVGKFDWINPFSSEGRATGGDVLRKWGVPIDREDKWSNLLPRMGIEALLDPVNWAGGYGLARKLLQRSAVKAANADSLLMRQAGYMPEEIAKLTTIVDKSGRPKRLYHGTTNASITGATDLSPRFAGTRQSTDHGYRGRGVYFGTNPRIAQDYNAGADMVFNDKPGPVTEGAKTVMAFVDMRSPYKTYAGNPWAMTEELDAQLGPFGRKWLNRDELHADDLKRMSQAQTNFLSGHGYDGVVSPLDGEIIAFRPDKIYAPYIAPAMTPVPRVGSGIAALLGYNTLVQPPRRTANGLLESPYDSD